MSLDDDRTFELSIDEFGRFPERPPSEVEWEELLVKYELTPRALRVALTDVENADASPDLRQLLLLLMSKEFEASLLLKAMRDGQPVGDWSKIWDVDDVRGIVNEFVGLRGRNFAVVQRRGIDVWQWAAEEGGTRVTPYRLILASVARDGQALAMVRDLARGARA